MYNLWHAAAGIDRGAERILAEGDTFFLRKIFREYMAGKFPKYSINHNKFEENSESEIQMHTKIGLDLLERVDRENYFGKLLAPDLGTVMAIMKHSSVLANPHLGSEAFLNTALTKMEKDLGITMKNSSEELFSDLSYLRLKSGEWVSFLEKEA